MSFFNICYKKKQDMGGRERIAMNLSDDRLLNPFVFITRIGRIGLVFLPHRLWIPEAARVRHGLAVCGSPESQPM